MFATGLAIHTSTRSGTPSHKPMPSGSPMLLQVTPFKKLTPCCLPSSRSWSKSIVNGASMIELLSGSAAIASCHVSRSRPTRLRVSGGKVYGSGLPRSTSPHLSWGVRKPWRPIWGVVTRALGRPSALQPEETVSSAAAVSSDMRAQYKKKYVRSFLWKSRDQYVWSFLWQSQAAACSPGLLALDLAGPPPALLCPFPASRDVTP